MLTNVISLLESYLYHLRVYVYQARNLCAMDNDSFSGKVKSWPGRIHEIYSGCKMLL